MSSQPLDRVRAVIWEDDHLRLLDQRRLPGEVIYLDYTDCDAVAEAISAMVVRGAPAIGVAAAYAVVLAARSQFQAHGEDWREHIQPHLRRLAEARPTAVNLRWAIAQMERNFAEIEGNPEADLLATAKLIHFEDMAANRRMGEFGADLIEQRCGILTHCNAGALATGGYGTALGVVRSAFAQEKIEQVYADETRPWFQGARLTAWELLQDDIPVTLLGEGAAATLMREGKVGWLIVGSDRIAANGDVANKIGTYSAAVNARHHGVKVMVVAPTSTIDMAAADGTAIPIEHRPEAEILEYHGQIIAAPGARAWNPSFDITPAGLVDAIVTERGVVLNPDAGKMADLMAE